MNRYVVHQKVKSRSKRLSVKNKQSISWKLVKLYLLKKEVRIKDKSRKLKVNLKWYVKKIMLKEALVTIKAVNRETWIFTTQLTLPKFGKFVRTEKLFRKTCKISKLESVCS